MNTTQSEPRSNVFCLTGILASLLLITSLLTDGNAHTVLPPPPSPTLTHPYSEKDSVRMGSETIKTQKDLTDRKQNSQGQKLLVDFEKNDHPKKKRMGLALIFLGILAEEG